MKFLVISVDTESDWFDKRTNKITSIYGLDWLQESCAKYDMTPTYLVTYEMATNDKAIKVIKEYLDNKQCEVGHHLHVWSTPPFENPNAYGVDEKWIDGIQSELSDDFFERKMKSLENAIKQNYGVKPLSHRAGRWSIDKRTLIWLEKNGYLVDTSVCPYISWTKTKGVNEYIKTNTSHAPNAPYYPDSEDLTKKLAKKEITTNILEVPATGIKGDFLSKTNFRGIYRLKSILRKFGYHSVRNMTFRPSDKWPSDVFLRLTNRIFQSDLSFVNLSFHSTELTLGTSPYSANKELLDNVKRNIITVLKQQKNMVWKVLHCRKFQFY